MVEYKSNITVGSNIFPRAGRDVNRDADFVSNVRGKNALLEVQKRLNNMSDVQLNPAQREQMKESITCATVYNYLREMTYGPVMTENGVEWQCRCENTDCENFSHCMLEPIVRKSVSVQEKIDIEMPEILEYEWLGTIDEIFSFPETTEELLFTEEEATPQKFSEAPVIVPARFIKIEEPSCIIEADIKSHIHVNAGPGTGKTYTVIERLAFIINSGIVDLSQVLVLCYTNAARDVILRRLEEKGLLAEAQQLVICTLDSLAWSNLSEKTEDNLFALGYNGCIQRFNNEFDEEEWTGFQYVIIDELQDIVNERARMTLNILNALNCGYLLLGDECQAIYDYDCNEEDSISSVEFYDELDSILPDTACRYELVENKRQSTELSHRSNDFRKALLDFSVQEANTFFENKIADIPKSAFTTKTYYNLAENQTTAILTRNNGEAEWISALLHKENICHNLMRSTTHRPSLNRWIADIFWDYRKPRISRDDFLIRYIIRLNSDETEAVSAYEAIVSLLSPDVDKEYISIHELNQALKTQYSQPSIIINTPCEKLTVSTIHKAKGREFDHVYLLSNFTPSNENTEEARIWYVGSTRPKMKLDSLSQLNKYVSKPTPMNRRMITGRRYGYTFCQRIVVGLQDDVDYYSFVYGNLYQALEIQQYISNCVSVNDTVELIKIDNIYRIIHNGFQIGSLDSYVTEDFWAAIRKTGVRYNIPEHLTDIYINNIVTVIPGAFPSGIDPLFKESKFWLGVELTGFAKADWHYGGA